MSRMARSLLGTVALTCPVVGAVGCQATIKAIEHPGQAVVRKGRGALIEREGMGVILTGMAVQLEEDEPLAGMKIELLNQSNRPVRLDVQDVILTGGDGLKRSPMDPGQFKRYADMAQGDPPPARVYRPVRVAVGVGHGGWHYGPYWHHGPPYGYYDDYYFVEEYYRRRERIARFVASLFKTRTVQPGFVDGGHVVFDYKLRRKETLIVEVTLRRMPTTQPATAPTSRPLQPTEPGPLFLRFYFKT